MRTATILALLIGPILFCRAVRAEEQTPEAFLAAARAKHLDHLANGLTSFKAEIVLRRSRDQSLNNYKELANFGYAFSAPKEEKFDFENTHESMHKPLRDMLGGMWRDLTGELWLGVLADAGEKRIREEANFTIVAGDLGEHGSIVATFENGPMALFDVELAKYKLKYTYGFELRNRELVATGRASSYQGAPVAQLEYRVFREVSGFFLPTVLVVETDRNRTEYAIRYETINGEPARLAELDEGEVLALVRAFETDWRSLDEEAKVAAVREIAETPHDLVSAAIAKQGLRDQSVPVRAVAAESLGVMQRSNVVPALLAALKKNEKELAVSLRIVQALGEIGDPRAVEALSKNWWNQRSNEEAVAMAKAKIRALGNIRCAASVDALINALYATKDETIGQIGADLLMAMKKLTGVDLGNDRQAWKDWWKKKRAGFEF